MNVPAICSLVVWFAFAVADAGAQTSEIVLPAATPEPGLIVPVPKPELLDLIPTFGVQDMQKSTTFYTDKLGFTVVLRSGSTYTAIGRDLVQIGLVTDKAASRAKSGSCYIKTSRIDELFRELKAAGVKITSELKTQPSNMREFSVTDPDNNVLVFGEYVGPK
ncbi:MAG TPA: VOC family protein [Terrimicrobiaceae bacterium]|nr:VOC family protein [Terrimicrobiaceae bacterium]